MSDDMRLETWNMETDEMTVLLDESWTQAGPDVDGQPVACFDSRAADESIFEHSLGDARVLDHDTGAKRVVLPLDIYWAVGIRKRWTAVNNHGRWGDSPIFRDLLEMSLMDSGGHVVPA